MRDRWSGDWWLNIPSGAVLATAVLVGMARVARTDLLEGGVVHDADTKMGCVVGKGRVPSDPWGGFSTGRWLWFLNDVEALSEPVPASVRQSFWQRDARDYRW